MDVQPIVMENAVVRLEPLAGRHRNELEVAANADQEIWQTAYPYSAAGAHFAKYWGRLESDSRTGARMPFAVLVDRVCVGITVYSSIDPENRSLEIGGTYYRPDQRGTGMNTAAKYEMLQHAFGSGANRVQFRVDAVNGRSCAALEKLGAVREGILREDRIVWTGRVRNTVIFSILHSEWPAIGARLVGQMQARHRQGR
ncbi:MAG TPA: GNAT family protein [Pseudolabrys sp.]|nr:GNAT family protein [Pseudolabrys sp.]